MTPRRRRRAAGRDRLRRGSAAPRRCAASPGLRDAPRFTELQVARPTGVLVPLCEPGRVDGIEAGWLSPGAAAAASPWRCQRAADGTWAASSRRPRPRRRAGAPADRLPRSKWGGAVREPAAGRGPPGPGHRRSRSCSSSSALLHLRFGAHALLVLSNVPFALIGGVVAPAITGRIPVGAGLGGLHRPVRHRGAERRGAGDLLQPAPGPGRPMREAVIEGAGRRCGRC